MRRLITYITIASGLMVAMALNFMGVVQTTRGNLEFANGRQFVYRMTDKENPEETIPEGAVDEMASTMEERLETALVTKYEIETEGNDQIRVTLGEDSQTSYQRIRDYLHFDGEFSICTTTDVCAVGDEMFEDVTAYVDYKGQFPHVVIPLSNPTYFIDQIMAEAKRIDEEIGQSGEGEINDSAYILLWANRLEGDTYVEAQTDSEVGAKILMRFNYLSIWWDEDAQDAITTAVDLSRYGTADANQTYPVSAVSQANAAAFYFVNLFNASPLAYDVEFLFETNVPASVDTILRLGSNISLAWSDTLLATIIAAVIVCGVLAYFYKLLSVAVIATSGTSLFLSALAFNLLGLQFSSAAIIGILTVAALTILSALLHVHKLRNEIYRGRTLKKAQQEASRKATWPIIDLSVATILFGLLTYILGGNLVRNFSVYVMLGGVANLLFVLLGMKLMTWLLTNEPGLNDKLYLFAVDKAKVPNTLNEEKQTYFGRYAHLNYTKQTTKVGIATALVAFLGAALTVFLALTSQSLIATPDNTIKTRLYFEVTDRSDIESSAWVEDNILAFITIDGEELSYESVTLHELTRIENQIEVDYRFYVVASTETYEASQPASYVKGATTYEGTLEEVLDAIVYGIDADEEVSTTSIHAVTNVSHQPNLGQLSLGVLAGLGAVMLYLTIRYFVARMLAILAVTSLGTFITLTFFLLSRMPSLTIAGLAMYVVALFGIYFAIALFSREKELIADEPKSADALEVRITNSAKATSQSASLLYVMTIMFAYVALNFFGFGPVVMSPLFAGVAVGFGLTLLFVLTLLSPWSLALAKLFHKWDIQSKLPKRKPRRRKNAPEAKSAEPQEAIFIGIND